LIWTVFCAKNKFIMRKQWKFTLINFNPLPSECQHVIVSWWIYYFHRENFAPLSLIYIFKIYRERMRKFGENRCKQQRRCLKWAKKEPKIKVNVERVLCCWCVNRLLWQPKTSSFAYDVIFTYFGVKLTVIDFYLHSFLPSPILIANVFIFTQWINFWDDKRVKWKKFNYFLYKKARTSRNFLHN
jgi:hypothetical protein